MINTKIARFYVALYGILALNSVNSECEVKDLVSQCGGFCFRAIWPILDHISYHHGSGSSLSDVNRQDSQLKLDDIGRQLAAQHQIQSSLASSQGEAKKIIPKNFEKIGSGFYYIEQNQKLNWFAAGDFCRRNGAHLVSFSNITEFNDVSAKVINTNEYWLDINNLGNKGEYISSTTGNIASFLKWHWSEPSGGSSNNCVLFWNSVMYDRTCEQLTLFVCEIDV
uniref:Accessory gland protein Acp29AB-like n=1 Tax=Drosophila rhopaloa TaxID=1041015 RepID=A0A6P4EWH7_DRORH